MEPVQKAEPAVSKLTVRQSILARRKQLGTEEISTWSQRITDLIMAEPIFHKARVIMGYAPCHNEVDISLLIQAALEQGKQVLLPVTQWEAHRLLPVEITRYPEDLVPGRLGILEPPLSTVPPWSLERIDLVIVPAVAFDIHGYRLGYGQGFYDRFLVQLLPETSVFGVAFSFQIVNSVYPEAHDCALPVIVSENGVISRS